jgi:hypothetical protein
VEINTYSAAIFGQATRRRKIISLGRVLDAPELQTACQEVTARIAALATTAAMKNWS